MLLLITFILLGWAEAGKKEAFNEGGGFGEQIISLLTWKLGLVERIYFCQNSIQFVKIDLVFKEQIQAIKEYDLDKDGKLDYNEFLKSHAKKWN